MVGPVQTRWFGGLGRIIAINLEPESLDIPITYTWFVRWKSSRLRKFRVAFGADECLSLCSVRHPDSAKVAPWWQRYRQQGATHHCQKFFLPDPRSPLWFILGSRTHSGLDQHSALCWKTYCLRSSLPGPFHCPLRTLACSALSPMNCKTDAALLSHSQPLLVRVWGCLITFKLVFVFWGWESKL